MDNNICYDKSFLKQVIARVDFAAPIASLRTSLSQKVGNVAVDLFPILEERKALAHQLQVSSDEFHHKQEEFTEWNYHGRNREKRLAIAPECAYVTYSQYSTFEALKEDFLVVINSLFKNYPDLRGSRFGLRYINNIDPAGHDPLEWKDLIEERLLGLFDRFSEQQESVTRLFNIAEFKHDDNIQVKFQFGAPNPDFPAKVRSPLFVLDIDAYIEGLQDISEVSANIDRAHTHIQKLFEQSITNGLRKLMHAK